MRRSIATVSLSGTLVEKLTAVAAAGFDGIELFDNDLLTCPLGPEAIRDQARDLGLSIDLYQPFRDAEALPEKHFERVMRRAAQKFGVMERLGATTLLVCSNVSGPTIDDDALAAEQLHRLADLASEHGVRIAYEALAWGRHVADYRHSWRIVEMAGHPSLGVCLDSFHILTRRDDPAGIALIPGEKIFYLQLADAPGVQMDPLFFSRHYRCFPGQGVLALREFTAAVLRTGYDGPLSLEVFNDVFRQADPEHTAVDAMRSLIALGDAVGREVPGRPTLTALPAVSEPEEFAFVELTVDAFTELSARDLLGRMGFTYRGSHRTKPVQIWQQGRARVVLTRAVPPAHRRERDKVTVSVIGVEDVQAARSAARAQALMAPRTARALNAGELRLPAVDAPDGTVLYFCRSEGPENWLTDFDIHPASDAPPEEAGIDSVDHVALSPDVDLFEESLLFYRSVLGLALQPVEEIPEPHGLLRSRALTSGGFRLVLNVPVFRGDHEPRGLQHIAFTCPDIFALAARFRAAGVPLLPIPANYYEDLAARTDLPAPVLTRMRDHGILYDHTPTGAFFHLYTRTLGTTLFFEAVQRTGTYTAFGAPNAPIRRAMQSLPAVHGAVRCSLRRWASLRTSAWTACSFWSHSGFSVRRASISAVVSGPVIPPRASPEIEIRSLAAATCRGWGPSRRRSVSQAGGSAWSAFSSSRETTPSWNCAGAADSRMSSFLAAVAGFMVCGVFALDVLMDIKGSQREGALRTPLGWDGDRR
ncbi:sugar phosphate isomerase/epimerase and 4-hydroxyphenylpyruvate domain-containing protein [Actinocorallia longicatena]|uniref:3-dehydroshikimate dehydratase n=1 Tax=Actinocorallia longicatena TaxID=111803 RepID=A0ABP6Q7K4_9ACTN